MAIADREKALEAALAQIEKQHGKGSVMRLGDEVRQPMRGDPHRRRSHSMWRLGIGGLPRGRMIEIYGPESTRQDHGVAARRSPTPRSAAASCAFIDAEHALDPAYAARLGVNIDALLVCQPDTGEQALEIAEMLVRSRRASISS